MAYVQKLIVLATAVCSAYAAATHPIISLATNANSNGNNLKDYITCIIIVVSKNKCVDTPMKDTSDAEMCKGVYQLTDCLKSNYGVCPKSDRDDVDKNFDNIETCKKVNDKCVGHSYSRRWCKDNGYNSSTMFKANSLTVLGSITLIYKSDKS
ncbi:unnamed protein product [Oppiella nova]|uniref:Uncharacterized protein n=1 Tax=Oppiella nova TaxID=334625 RepID=A0A7R9MAH1_9ACAR|nr:unnamed protein product [Oppiella nova]CAG2172509.1 unnamed protein product [Oppiella nova]